MTLTRRTSRKKHKQRKFGNIGNYLPSPNSDHKTLLGALAIILLLRIGLHKDKNLEQEIKNSEYGALWSLTLESVIDSIQYLGRKIGFPTDRGIIVLCYLIIFSLIGASDNI